MLLRVLTAGVGRRWWWPVRWQSEDPSDLIAALQLDRGVQQDGHEFLKLLLSLLASKLGGCKGAIDAGAVSLVQDLFRGQASYATTCQARARSESRGGVFDVYGHGPYRNGREVMSTQ